MDWLAESSLLKDISVWVLYFMVYSILGYIFEIVYCSLQAKEFKNRGFLYGPWLPIYGTGMVLVLLITQWLNWPWWANFFLIILLCDTLEYITSVLMEKIFHMRWWDYTNNTVLNLNGRISLETSLGFGVGGMLVLTVIHPMVSHLIGLLPETIMLLLVGISAGLYIMDTVLSWIAALNVKGMLDGGRIDLTAEIKKFTAHYYEDIAKHAKLKKLARQKKRAAKRSKKAK